MPAKTKTTAVPSKSPKAPLHTGPKEVFLQLMMMAMLYIGVISLLMLAFAYIDLKFPDLLGYYPEGDLRTIRNASSMLIVSFPLFLIFAGLVQKDFRQTPEKHELRFWKWLVYLTLFVSSITLVVDLIQLVNKFYSGDLTTPFALKVLCVFVVAGGVLGYYIWDTQNKPQKSEVPKTVAIISAVVVLVTLVAGFMVAGSPAQQRLIRMDQERLNDLQAIQGRIVNYWQLKGELPQSLDQLNDSISGFTAPTDPETKAPYTYSTTETLKFSLCANFNKPTPETEKGSDASSRVMVYPGGGMGENWIHEAGHFCFERTIDPELYNKNNPYPVFY